jgi:hypothetical protein
MWLLLFSFRISRLCFRIAFFISRELDMIPMIRFIVLASSKWFRHDSCPPCRLLSRVSETRSLSQVRREKACVWTCGREGCERVSGRRKRKKSSGSFLLEILALRRRGEGSSWMMWSLERGVRWVGGGGFMELILLI